MEQEVEQPKNEATQVKGCKQCKKGMSKTQWGLLIFSLYMFGSGIYGTYHILKDIISLF